MNITSDKNRLVGFDFLRFFAIVLVFFSHYIQTSDLNLKNFFLFLGILGNGTFFFISGYLIYLKNDQIISFDDVKIFYKKRIKRIYPLYWIALSLFLLSTLIQKHSIHYTIPNIISTYVGLQMVFYPLYIPSLDLMLWFIGIIVIYYLIYPAIVLPRSKGVIGLFFYSIVAILPLVLLKLGFGLFGGGIFEYYPLFVLGILAANVKYFETDFYRYSKNFSFLFFVALFVFALINYTNIGDFDTMSNLSIPILITISSVILLRLMIVIFFILAIFTIFNEYVPKTKNVLNLVTIGSVGSYALYLLHTLPYPIVWFFVKPDTDPGLFNLVVVLILLPILVFLCYHIQIMLDRITSKKISTTKTHDKNNIKNMNVK